MHVPIPTTRDIGLQFNTVEEAALGACDYLKTQPKPGPYERAGCIYDERGVIRVGAPESADVRGFCLAPDPPPGTRLVAEYHDHLSTETFSEIDLSTKRKVTQILCTPSGAVLMYEVGQTTRRLR